MTPDRNLVVVMAFCAFAGALIAVTSQQTVQLLIPISS